MNAPDLTPEAPMRVLLVDDSQVNLKIYAKLFASVAGTQCVCFNSSSEALKWCAANDPDLVVVDYKMPAPDGIEFIRRFREMPGKSRLPLIMLTGERDRDIRHRALEFGANDFVTKPADPVEFITRARNLLALRDGQKKLASHADWLRSEVKRATAQLAAREQESIFLLTKTAEFRDNETGNHIIRMGHFSMLLGRALDLPPDEQDLLLLAAPMHDIGKVATPDSVLLKPGKLTPTEWDVMRRHASAGYEILRHGKSPLMQKAAEIALSHHEKYDGSGYPGGLAGWSIPLSGRICAVADVFDALTSRRPYKAAWSADDAKRMIEEGSGKHFDPDVVSAFDAMFEEIVVVKAQFADVEVATA